MLRFKGGARGMLWVSQLTAGRKNRLSFEIAGANQALWFDGEKPNELWIGNRNSPNGFMIKDPGLLGDTARLHCLSVVTPKLSRQLKCFKAFYDYIAAGDSVPRPSSPPLKTAARSTCEAI